MFCDLRLLFQKTRDLAADIDRIRGAKLAALRPLRPAPGHRVCQKSLRFLAAAILGKLRDFFAGKMQVSLLSHRFEKRAHRRDFRIELELRKARIRFAVEDGTLISLLLGALRRIGGEQRPQRNFRRRIHDKDGLRADAAREVHRPIALRRDLPARELFHIELFRRTPRLECARRIGGVECPRERDQQRENRRAHDRKCAGHFVQSSVRKGDAGRPAALMRLHSGLSAHA